MRSESLNRRKRRSGTNRSAPRPGRTWHPYRTFPRAGYGAVGDGQGDDTAALQKALDDLHREDRKFFVPSVPAGTYRVTRTLVLFREKHNESKDVSEDVDCKRNLEYVRKLMY